MPRSTFVLAVFTLTLLTPRAAGAQPQTPSSQAAAPPLRVVIGAFGGLLGQVEGFCEYPGGPYDETSTLVGPPCAATPRWPSWLGGVIGLKAAAERFRTSATAPGAVLDRWLLLAPDNEPSTTTYGTGATDAAQRSQAEFWQRVEELKADAIGIGTQDFVRRLRVDNGTEPAAAYVAWLAQTPLKLLASNAAIRRTGKKLNVTKSGPYELTFDAHTSVSWLSSVTVLVPCGSDPALKLAEFSDPASTPRPVAAKWKARAGTLSCNPQTTDPERRDVVIGEGTLLPGKVYQLEVATSVLRFQTDDALVVPGGNPAPFAGMPVVARENSPVLAVGFVSPAVKDELGDAAWKFTTGCGAEHCEIVFLDPEKVAAALLTRASSAGRATPFMVLVSALRDDEAPALMAAVPEIRIVVLPPDSDLLSRAFDEVEAGNVRVYSGDRGFTGVFDADTPIAAKVLVRPEWFGETVATIHAALESEAGAKRWRMTGPRAIVELVPGVPLIHRAGSGEVTYTAVTATGPEGLGRFRAYPHCTAATSLGGRCRTLYQAWTGEENFLVLAAYAVKDAAQTELAALQASDIDSDYMAWVSTLTRAQGTGWLSRFILEKVVYRSSRMVRTTVGGDKLFDVLKQIADASNDSAVCVAGLQGGCPIKLDAKHPERLMVNTRRVESSQFYSLALPDHLAESLKLEHDEGRAADLANAIDAFLHGGARDIDGPAPALAERIERHNNGGELRVAFPTADLKFSSVSLRNPPGRPDVRSNLSLRSSAAEAVETLTTTLAGDVALDYPRVAIRVPLKFDVVRRDESPEGGPMKRVYERDELSYGLRADVKTRALREIRWFGGRFRETVVYSHEARYRASRDAAAPEGRDVKVKETTNFELIYVVPEPRFTHWRIGGDVLDISKFALGHGVTADVKRFGVDFSWGDTDHLITGAIVGDRIFEAQELLEAGVQGVLNRFFTDTPDAMAPGLAFGPQTQDSERTRRLQFALDGQLTLTALPNKPTIALTTNFRYYGYRTTTVSPLALRWTHDLTVRVTSKLWKRLQGVCAVDFQNAHIRTDAPNSFKHIRFELGFALPVVLKFGNGRTAG